MQALESLRGYLYLITVVPVCLSGFSYRQKWRLTLSPIFVITLGMAAETPSVALSKLEVRKIAGLNPGHGMGGTWRVKGVLLDRQQWQL